MNHTITFQHAEAIKQLLFNKISTYLDKQGITVSTSSLNDNISFTRDEFSQIITPPQESSPKPTPKSPKKTKVKLNVKKATTTNTAKKQIKLKPKPKPKTTTKLKPKPKPKPVAIATPVDKPDKLHNIYDTFIQICQQYNIPFFKWNDEHDWHGPAIKIPDTQLELYTNYFSIITLTHTKVHSFYILRPKDSFDDSHIQYPKNNTQCKLQPKTLVTINSDNEDIYDAETEGEEEDSDDAIETTPWTFKNTKYLVDLKNNVYSYDTFDFVGVKIDEFNIDTEAKEQ